MKKTAIAILIAVLVVAIGAGLCFAGLSAVGFKLEVLDMREYETNTYDFGDPVREIDVEGRTADLELLPAEDGKCRVVCFENDREKYAVDLADGRLIIRPASDGKGWHFSLFTFKSPRISVYLPAGTYDALRITLHTGDITADKALSFVRLEAELNTGDLTLNGVQANEMRINGATGDIRHKDVTPDMADLSLSTGKIELVNVVCSGDLRCKNSTGDIRLTDIDAANLYLKASTGDITGTIRTPKIFTAHASTGKVSVPAASDSAVDGRCEAETSTGDIRLSVNGQ